MTSGKKIFDSFLKIIPTLLKVGFGVFIIYYLIYFLTPNIEMSIEQRNQIDSLNQSIKKLHEDNLRMETKIQGFESEVLNIDSNIQNIKGQKTIIKEYYHEKINSVDRLTIAELDSFFAKRYGY